MGLFDKLKSAVNAVTGGAAKVTLTFEDLLHFPGDTVDVLIHVSSTGAEVTSGGIFIDVLATEEVKVTDTKDNQTITRSKTTIQQTFQVAPALLLAAGETKKIEATVTLPTGIQPTFRGTFATHQCYLRARLEAFGNDPDSGYLPVRIGANV